MSRDKQVKRKVRADPHRVMAWLDSIMVRPVLRVVLSGLLVGALVILLSPKLLHSDRQADQLKVGQPALGNIKASRDFTYQPPEADTLAKREKAAGLVPPVFDHDRDMGERLSRSINAAFASLARKDAGVKPAPTPPPAANSDASAGSADPQELKRREFCDVLEVDLPASDFNKLISARTLREVRGILLLTLVVEGTGKEMVITRPKNLARFKGQPVAVRHIRGKVPVASEEEKLANHGTIKDLAGARKEVQQRAESLATKLPPALAKVVVALAQRLVQPNLRFNQEETERRRDVARRGVKPTTIPYVKGQVIVRDGDALTAKHLRILDQMEPKTWDTGRVQIPIGVGIFLLCLLVWQFRFARREFARFFDRPRDLLAMAVLLLGLVGLTKSVVALGGGMTRGQEVPVFLYAVPIAAGAMLVRLLITAEAAAVFGTVTALICGLVVDQSLFLSLFYMTTGLVGAAGVSQVQSRSTILRAGLYAGLVGAIAVLGFQMYQGAVFSAATFYYMAAAVAGGLLTAFATLALLPAMEWLFAYTTDVTLLELANLNHPLMRDLILHAPGTYHHSMIVGNLAEEACESIGANGLLARVAAYYHDIGKAKNAEYFAENHRPGENPHNRLKPSMSGLIIRSHVKDTIELLGEHSVSQLVIDTATQHHGTSLIEYFYNKAKEQEEPEGKISEEDYRYSGPKPQSREAGVLMLADGVEAAARSLPDPSEDRLQAVVQRVIRSKFTDGQLDNCDVTLQDLHLIARSFLRVLRGIYHQRPTYPWQKQHREERRAKEEEGRPTGKHRAEADAGEEAAAEKDHGAKQQGKDVHKSKGERRSKKRESGEEPRRTEGRGKRAPTQDAGKPNGDRAGKKGAADNGAPADTQESDPDLKRLGLD